MACSIVPLSGDKARFCSDNEVDSVKKTCPVRLALWFCAALNTDKQAQRSFSHNLLFSLIHDCGTTTLANVTDVPSQGFFLGVPLFYRLHSPAVCQTSLPLSSACTHQLLGPDFKWVMMTLCTSCHTTLLLWPSEHNHSALAFVSSALTAKTSR